MFLFVTQKYIANENKNIISVKDLGTKKEQSMGVDNMPLDQNTMNNIVFQKFRLPLIRHF